MRLPVMLMCVFAACAAGCAFKAGAEQETLKTTYRGEIKYSAEDVSEERAEWGVLEYRISRAVGAGCERRRTVQDYDTCVPYRPGVECGNFIQGVVSCALLPVTVPLFALSGSEPKILGDHFKQIGHNLNIFLATPPDDAYLFTTPVRRKAAGEPRESGWEPVAETRTMPLKNARVEIRIDALGFASYGVTGEDGTVSFDMGSAAGEVRIQEGRSFAEVAVQLIIKDESAEGGAPVIGAVSRVYRRPSGTGAE